MPAKRRITVSGSKVADDTKQLCVRLTVKFDPKVLGDEKTEKLLHGLVAAVAEVLSPADLHEMSRQLEAERMRLLKSSAPKTPVVVDRDQWANRWAIL